MKTRVLLAFSVCCAALVTAYAEDKEKKPETGLSGKWVTEAVDSAIPDVKSRSVLGQFLESAGNAAAQNVPGTGPGPRGGPSRGRVQVDTAPRTVVEKGSSPDGAALILELRAEKSKLSGKVTEVVSGASLDIEEAKLTGAKFEFATYRKVVNAKTPTYYKGELTDNETIVLTRSSISGKIVDQKDGSPTPLVFKRAR